MKKLLYFVFVLSFMGCSNENTEIENYIDDNSNKNEPEISQSVNGFDCYIEFTGNKYIVKAYKGKDLSFTISDEITDRKQYIDLQYGQKKEIIISNIQIYNILQYKDTFYLLLNLSDNGGIVFWGIRKFYSIEKDVINKQTFNNIVFLPTMMRFWFENSLLFTANSTIYPEASISESRIYDGQFNLITNQYPPGKVLDMFHTINISKGYYDINPPFEYIKDNITYKDIREPKKNLWKFEFQTYNNDFIVNDWDTSYTSNNSISVTANITFANGEKEKLEFELDKETGYLIE